MKDSIAKCKFSCTFYYQFTDWFSGALVAVYLNEVSILMFYRYFSQHLIDISFSVFYIHITSHHFLKNLSQHFAGFLIHVFIFFLMF